MFSEIVRDDARSGILANVIDYLSQERLLSDLERTFASVDRMIWQSAEWLSARGIVVNGPAPPGRIDTYPAGYGTPVPPPLGNVSIGTLAVARSAWVSPDAALTLVSGISGS